MNALAYGKSAKKPKQPNMVISRAISNIRIKTETVFFPMKLASSKDTLHRASAGHGEMILITKTSISLSSFTPIGDKWEHSTVRLIMPALQTGLLIMQCPDGLQTIRSMIMHA